VNVLLGQVQSAVQFGIRQNHEQLLASPTAYDVVAHIMAAVVVNSLELVQITQYQAERMPVAGMTSDQLLKWTNNVNTATNSTGARSKVLMMWTLPSMPR
jgi:hypothetical protein